MKFNLRVDPGALVNLDGVSQGSTGVQVTESDLVVTLGPEFEANISRTAIAGVEAFPDPRPGVYFPMGLSSAVKQMGPDTVCVVTSYDGLVKVNLNQEVEGKGTFIEPVRPKGSLDTNTPIVTPAPIWRTLLRVLVVIVAIVIFFEAAAHGYGWWVILLYILLLLGYLGWSALSAQRAKQQSRASAPTERQPITFRHIVISLEDPDGFMRALNQRGGAVAARPVQ